MDELELQEVSYGLPPYADNIEDMDALLTMWDQTYMPFVNVRAPLIVNEK